MKVLCPSDIFGRRDPVVSWDHIAFPFLFISLILLTFHVYQTLTSVHVSRCKVLLHLSVVPLDSTHHLPRSPPKVVPYLCAALPPFFSAFSRFLFLLVCYYAPGPPKPSSALSRRCVHVKPEHNLVVTQDVPYFYCEHRIVIPC